MLGERYQLRRRIGVGSMGIVYEAEQLDQGDAVAVKVLQQHLAPDPAVRARFRREAHATVGLSNPHLVKVKDFQSPPDDPPYLVMELLHGQTLQLLLKQEGPMSAERAARLAVQGLSALQVAHDAGIVHRDIKPDNLFVMPQEAGDTLKLLDFGVARLLHEDDTALGTESGAWVGTPSFMAPEQVRCKPVDGRADIYAMGACLYQMVTGRLPIEMQDTVALLSAIIERVPAPVTSHRPELPEAFAQVVARALNKNPAERFATAAEMAEALAPWAGGQRHEHVANVATTSGAAASLATEEPRHVQEHPVDASPSGELDTTPAALPDRPEAASVPALTAEGGADASPPSPAPATTADALPSDDDDDATVVGLSPREVSVTPTGDSPAENDAVAAAGGSPSSSTEDDEATVSGRLHRPAPRESEAAPPMEQGDTATAEATQASAGTSLEGAHEPVVPLLPEEAIRIGEPEDDDATVIGAPAIAPRPSGPILIGGASDDDDDATVVAMPEERPKPSEPIHVGGPSDDDGDDATVIELSPERATRAPRPALVAARPVPPATAKAAPSTPAPRRATLKRALVLGVALLGAVVCGLMLWR
ncbi:protein kinase [Myxococcus sp. K15C18031901]|uniref:protein kinase domain-containing protein n=1 Tax=Myxococcus dinghuensis TaxID=2906761 RepID=UPI0020A7E36F|nr:protein kinase [Myxococcus dinghuensis]MCP3102857.1 protein kinase [Myxococcus dinghuensis]